MRGRPPKPIQQKIREGNAGKRALPKPLVLDRQRHVPTKPNGLPADASELWDSLVPMLHAAGIVEAPDAIALEAVCVQFARARQMRRAIAEDSPFALGSTGQLVEHPALGAEARAHQLLIRFLEQFGLTPASRARIAASIAGVRSALDEELAGVIDMTPELRAVE